MRWDEIDQQVCSVARALSVVGDRWTLLILRDCFMGTRRFEQFQRQLGITRHRLSQRLARLVEQGILTRKPYQQRPLRHEYRLTRKGLALYPVMLSLAAWGDEWMGDGNGAPVEYRHKTCGAVTHPVLACSHCGETLRPGDVQPTVGPGLRAALGDAQDDAAEAPLAELLARTAPGY
jgi:DNA-binding HxlR family transcriptional regulator